MKKLLRVLTSRSLIIALLIVFQMGFFAVILYFFSRLFTISYTLLTLICVFVMAMAFEKNKLNPAYKMMWILLIVPLPLSGTLFYLLFGNRRISPKKAQTFNSIEKNVIAATPQNEALFQALKAKTPEIARNAQYLKTYANAPLYGDTKSTYFSFGDDFFPAFLQQAEQAKRSIFLEYFIIDEGELWDQTVELLKRKASQGVDVRLIYDAFGCLSTLPQGYDATLRAAGIKCHIFNPAHLSWHFSDYTILNHRDHRKIAIIDGEVGFTGGANFADEYINRINRFGVWKDTGFMLQGAGVYALSVMFLQMWDFVTGSISPYEQYMPQGRFEADGFVQPYADSPLDSENVAESAYFNVIRQAKDYVYLTTPYLILDNEMLTCLCITAKSGVDVRIITPAIPDKWYVHYVTRSYYADLIRAGVRIYEYTPGFIHAKMYVSDDAVAIVGSANMDYRSLYLHFENCCSFYGGHIVNDVKQDILQTLEQCEEISLTQMCEMSVWVRAWQVFLRFWAPMM